MPTRITVGADTAGEYRALAAAGAVDGDARGRHNLVEGVDDAVRNPVRITPGETLDRRWRRSRRSPPWGNVWEMYLACGISGRWWSSRKENKVERRVIDCIIHDGSRRHGAAGSRRRAHDDGRAQEEARSGGIDGRPVEYHADLNPEESDGGGSMVVTASCFRSLLDRMTALVSPRGRLGVCDLFPVPSWWVEFAFSWHKALFT